MLLSGGIYFTLFLFLLYYSEIYVMVVINSNNVSIYSCICHTTLSGRPGGYPDDDLIIKKNKKNKKIGSIKVQY